VEAEAIEASWPSEGLGLGMLPSSRVGCELGPHFTWWQRQSIPFRRSARGHSSGLLSVAASSQRIAPPHRGQVSMSTWKTCRSTTAAVADQPAPAPGQWAVPVPNGNGGQTACCFGIITRATSRGTAPRDWRTSARTSALWDQAPAGLLWFWRARRK